MQIISDTQLDFCDVLIRPQSSSLNHRSEVETERNFKKFCLNACPIMNANMTQTGTFDVAKKMVENKMFGTFHKFYTAEQIKNFFEENQSCSLYFITIGLRNKDEEIKRLKELNDYHFSILIDVPNAYIPEVENYVKEVRAEFPHRIIAVGNVCTGDITQQLIKAGADIVKIGIGPSCFIGNTLIKTSKGLVKIKDIKENDLVLTHTGTYKKVINKFQFTNKNDLIDINGIKCTKNHKFFVINKSDIEKVNENNYCEYAYWMEAKDLTKNQVLVKIK